MAGENFAVVDYWTKRWENNDSPWHKDFIHPCLLQHYKKLIPVDQQEGKVRVFLPLCGKSLDMLWLAEHGFQVVGLEAVESAVKMFFTENDLKYEVKTSPGSADIKYYTSVDESKDVSIYIMDVFHASKEKLGEEFDAVWDRGSMSAIGLYQENRGRRYVDILTGLLKHHGKVMIENHIYLEDPGPHRGPPSHLPPEVLHELFGDGWDITPLDMDQSGIPPSIHFKRVYNLISLKTKN